MSDKVNDKTGPDLAGSLPHALTPSRPQSLTPSLPHSLIAKATAAIHAAHRVVIATHVNPDGDALGSLCALALACERLQKETVRVSVDGVPAMYAGLPSVDRVVTAAPPGSFDLGIGVDADGADRLGAAQHVLLACPTVIDIDHHTGADRYGTVQLIDPTAAATGELVFDLIRALAVPLDPEIAVCLMMAIVTDTGTFRFPSVKPRTLRIAADLMEAGAHPAPIVEQVYGQRSPGATRLFGRALERMGTGPAIGPHGSRDRQIAWSALSREDFRETGAREDETDGIINELRAVQGVDLAMLLRESSDGQIRVSFRAREGVDAAALAARFGGGGHRAASGATLPGPLSEALRRVIEAAAEVTSNE